MQNTSASDILIFGVVLGLRLLVPLAIPRYPLPGILTAFLIDAVDKSVFQSFTNLDLDFYQSYDKALDNSRVLEMDLGRVGDHLFVEAAGVGLDAGLYECFAQLERGAPMVSVASGPFVGAAYAIAPEACVDDGLLDVVVFHGATVLRLLVHLFAIAGGRSLPHPPEASHVHVRKLQVSRRQRRPLAVHADGEPLGATPTGFEVEPAVLRVIVGTPEPSGIRAWA